MWLKCWTMKLICKNGLLCMAFKRQCLFGPTHCCHVGCSLMFLFPSGKGPSNIIYKSSPSIIPQRYTFHVKFSNHLQKSASFTEIVLGMRVHLLFPEWEDVYWPFANTLKSCIHDTWLQKVLSQGYVLVLCSLLPPHFLTSVLPVPPQYFTISIGCSADS